MIKLTLVLGVATLCAILSMIWLGRELHRTRSALAEQKIHLEQVTQKGAEDLCRAHLEHARMLVELGKPAEAQQVCTLAINLAKGYRPSALEEVFKLRGEIRETLGDAGAAEDFLEAVRLGRQ